MGIQASNIIVGFNKKEPAPEPQVSNIRKAVKPVVGVESIKEPSVIVDGKVKKISKKSAFLLDMLSLDD